MFQCLSPPSSNTERDNRCLESELVKVILNPRGVHAETIPALSLSSATWDLTLTCNVARAIHEGHEQIEVIEG